MSIFNASKTSIFLFHEINNIRWFEDVVHLLKKRYRFISLKELVECFKSGKTPEGCCHLTFDDGHLSFYTKAWPILKAYQIPATLFVSPKVIETGELYWFQRLADMDTRALKEYLLTHYGHMAGTVKKTAGVYSILKSLPIQDILNLLDGVETDHSMGTNHPQNITRSQLKEMADCSLLSVGAHTINHPILANETIEDSTFEIKESVERLEEMTGREIDAFAYPNGKFLLDFSYREKRILKATGIKLAFTTELDSFSVTRTDPFSIPRIDLSYNSRAGLLLKILAPRKWQQIKNLLKTPEEKERWAIKRQLAADKNDLFLDRPMKKTLIINKEQFGYHVDVYKMYNCLSEKCVKLSMICWDDGFPKIKDDHRNVHYIRPQKNIFIKNILFLRQCIRLFHKKKYDFVFVKHFIGCSVLLLFLPRHKLMMDVRASSDKKNLIFRWLENLSIKAEAMMFSKVSIISHSLRGQLNIRKHKTYILPLGADIKDLGDKEFEELHVLYVGTLYQRRIEETLSGFISFYERYKDKVTMSYTIVGDGKELPMLKKMVKKASMEKIISFKGYVPNNQLEPILKKSNVGISYIPITPYFDNQPPTKTFEYLLSGMPVIATQTHENSLIIDDDNGILIDDNPRSFETGLERFYQRKHLFQSRKIKQSVTDSTWDNIFSRFIEDWIQ